MAMENAKQFVEKVKADAALSERMKGMTPREGLALAKEMGLEFTEEELKAALGVEELSLEDMDKCGGRRLPHAACPKEGQLLRELKWQA